MDGEDDRIENSKAERDLEVTRRARITQQQCGTRIAAKCGAAKSILLICKPLLLPLFPSNRNHMETYQLLLAALQDPKSSHLPCVFVMLGWLDQACSGNIITAKPATIRDHLLDAAFR
jgi:hypothetical protein